ncbi:hypothetical protein ACFL0V_06355 [Nanoarchaeota archaeon]
MVRRDKKLTDNDLTELIEEAFFLKWGPDKTTPDYSQAHNVLMYIIERMSQHQAVLTSFRQTDEAQRLIREKLYFFTIAVGRIAELEGAPVRASGYGRYDLLEGGNQVDQFLERIGYLTDEKRKDEKRTDQT